jgi:hypothetical protein
MNRFRDRLSSTARHVLQSWVTWVALGAAAGTGVLFSAGVGASDPNPADAPSGVEIEAAVAKAEAEANAARIAEPAE